MLKLWLLAPDFTNALKNAEMTGGKELHCGGGTWVCPAEAEHDHRLFLLWVPNWSESHVFVMKDHTCCCKIFRILVFIWMHFSCTFPRFPTAITIQWQEPSNLRPHISQDRCLRYLASERWKSLHLASWMKEVLKEVLNAGGIKHWSCFLYISQSMLWNVRNRNARPTRIHILQSQHTNH